MLTMDQTVLGRITSPPKMPLAFVNIFANWELRLQMALRSLIS